MNPPNYLVQTLTNELFVYWRIDILLADLATNKEFARIWTRNDSGPVIRYVSITEAELRKQNTETKR